MQNNNVDEHMCASYQENEIYWNLLVAACICVYRVQLLLFAPKHNIIKEEKKNHFLHYKRKRTAFSINFFSSTHMQTFTHCALTNDNKLQYVVEFFGRNIEIRVHQLQSNHVDQKLLNKIGTYAYELDDGSKKRRKRNQF